MQIRLAECPTNDTWGLIRRLSSTRFTTSIIPPSYLILKQPAASIVPKPQWTIGSSVIRKRGNSGFVVGRRRPPREACDNFWDARSRTLSAHSRNRGSLVRGLGGIETGGWRDPRSARAPQHDRLAVSGMRSGMQAVRPSARTAMATPGYLQSAARGVPQVLLARLGPVLGQRSGFAYLVGAFNGGFGFSHST
jgi:hypothetical protein